MSTRCRRRAAPIQASSGHDVHANGLGGTVISENTDISELHDAVLAYWPWLEFEIIPILAVDDAVPTLLRYFG